MRADKQSLGKMDIQVVAIEREDHLNNAVSGASAIMLSGKYIITTSSILSDHIVAVETNLEELHNVSKNSTHTVIYKDSKNDDRFVTKTLEVFAVFKSKTINSTAKFTLKDWAIDAPEVRRDLHEILSTFFVLKIKDLDAHMSEFLRLLTNWWSSIKSETLNITEEIYIKSTPFGNRRLLNCYNRGIVSNKVGQEGSLIVSDCPTTPGSEGGAVYKLNSEVPIGIVLSSSSWWRSEWTGLTLFADIRFILAELLHRHYEDDLKNIPHPRLLATIESSIVQVYCGSEWGTAILIDAENGILLTNSHVISENHDIKIFWKGYWCIASLIYQVPSDQVFDVAVLRCDSDFLKTYNLRCIQTSADSLNLNDEVFAAGFAIFPKESKNGPTISRGYVTKKNESMLITSCCVNPGMSGGVILNKEGVILGVIVCNTKLLDINAVYPRFNMAIPYDVVKGCINQYLETKNTSTLEGLWSKNYMHISPWRNFQAKL